MPVVKARQCPFTKELFPITQRKRYFNHLMKIRASLKEQRERGRMDAKFEAFRQELWQLPDFNAMEEFVLKNQKTIWYFAAHYESGYELKLSLDGYQDIELTDFSITDLHFVSCLSNSHSCPVNGVRNWNRNSKNPTSYPGFYGRVTFKFKKGHGNISISSLFHKLGFCTGSGGGGSNHLSYDVSIWCDDFKIIGKKIECMYNEYSKEIHREKVKFDEEAMIKKIKGVYAGWWEPKPFRPMIPGLYKPRTR